MHKGGSPRWEIQVRGWRLVFEISTSSIRLLSHIPPYPVWWLMAAAVQGSQCRNLGSLLCFRNGSGLPCVSPWTSDWPMGDGAFWICGSSNDRGLQGELHLESVSRFLIASILRPLDVFLFSVCPFSWRGQGGVSYNQTGFGGK